MDGLLLHPLVGTTKGDDVPAKARVQAYEVLLDRSPNRHVAFGVGIHRCLGSHLARLEVTVAVERFLAAHLRGAKPQDFDRLVRQLVATLRFFD